LAPAGKAGCPACIAPILSVRNLGRGLASHQHHPKTVIVVTIIGVVVVAVGTAQVVTMIVERPATQHTAAVRRPSHLRHSPPLYNRTDVAEIGFSKNFFCALRALTTTTEKIKGIKGKSAKGLDSHKF
jgi:hypothetical protein